MSYFEGIGDEVVIFTVALAIILAVILKSLIQQNSWNNATPAVSQRFLQEQLIQPQTVPQRLGILSSEQDANIQVLETIPESLAESDYQINSDQPVPPCDILNEHSQSCAETTNDQEVLVTKSDSSIHNSNSSDTAQLECEQKEAACSSINDSQDVQLNEVKPIVTDSINENNPDAIRQRRLDFFTKKPKETADIVTNTQSCTLPEVKTLQNQANGLVSAIIETETPLHEAERLPTDETSTIPNIPIGNTEGEFRIRLKFLDDREDVVTARSDELVADFKRRIFPEELSQRKVIRLIYSGQQLQDTRTLQMYRLSEGSVVHIQISSGPAEDRSTQNRTNEELDVGRFLWPLLGVILGGLWTMHFQYRDMFNASSTVALIGLSGLYLTFVWAQFGQQPLQTP